MKTITVKELCAALAVACNAGLGDKKILLSNDDEGNGYHECFQGWFNVEKGWFDGRHSLELPYGVSPGQAENEYIIIA